MADIFQNGRKNIHVSISQFLNHLEKWYWCINTFSGPSITKKTKTNTQIWPNYQRNNKCFKCLFFCIFVVHIFIWIQFLRKAGYCLASPANFIYGRVLAKVLSHVTIMPVLLRPVNNFLGQVIGNASEGIYNTVNNSSSGEVTFQKCLNSGITIFSSKNSNKSQTFVTGAYQRLHEALPIGVGTF